jgi:hypothetical protein
MELREEPTQRPAHGHDIIVSFSVLAAGPRRRSEAVPIGFGPEVSNPDPAEVVGGKRIHRVLLSGPAPIGPTAKRMRRRTEARRRD